jgi:hypothetical protein
MFKHVLEIADEFAISTRWDSGLVHVEGAGKSRRDVFQAKICPRQKYGFIMVHHRTDFCLPPADIG